MEELKYKVFIKKLTRRFGIAFVVLIVIFLVEQFFLQYQITQLENISHSINVAGDRYDLEVKLLMKDIKLTHMVLFGIIIGLLLFIAYLIFIPISKTLKNALGNVNVANENLIKMFHTMKNSLLVVRRDGEILFMNKDAEKNVLYEKGQPNSRFLDKNMNWLGFDIMSVIEKINKDNRIEDIETNIEDKEGKVLSVLVSAVAGNYSGSEAVMIQLYDITARKKAEEVLKNISMKDELTGLYNRHFLDSIILQEIERAQRYEIPLSAVILDLDHFKRVNDHWGHPVGDSVLQFTAELIINHTRISDYVILIGGEEILILMPNTSSKGAVAAAEKVRKAIEDATHPIIGKFTASFGVAERNSGEQYQDLYNRVDEALYRAKENGRNCVVEAQSLGSEYAAISFKWNKNWNCGEEIIDEQHKELFRMVSQLAHSSYLKEEKAKVLKYIDDISIYLIKHFKYEEAILAKVGYQDLLNHKTIHGHLYKRGEEIRNAVENDTMDGMKAFAYIFDELIVGHLLSEDTLFYSYFQPK